MFKELFHSIESFKMFTEGEGRRGQREKEGGTKGKGRREKRGREGTEGGRGQRGKEGGREGREKVGGERGRGRREREGDRGEETHPVNSQSFIKDSVMNPQSTGVGTFQVKLCTRRSDMCMQTVMASSDGGWYGPSPRPRLKGRCRGPVLNLTNRLISSASDRPTRDVTARGGVNCLSACEMARVVSPFSSGLCWEVPGRDAAGNVVGGGGGDDDMATGAWSLLPSSFPCSAFPSDTGTALEVFLLVSMDSSRSDAAASTMKPSHTRAR